MFGAERSERVHLLVVRIVPRVVPDHDQGSGRLVDVEGSSCHFADDLERNLAVGDEGYHDFVAAADALARDPAFVELVESEPETRHDTPAALGATPRK